MAILRFRIYFEEDESIYRDVVLKTSQMFSDLHSILLRAFEFDSKHQATFYRSNDLWQRGREITLEVYDKPYLVPPLLMSEATLKSEIKETNQRFIFEYDFAKVWTFLIELINISKDEVAKIQYPSIVRSVGIAQRQYGAKGLLGDKFADIEAKFNLNALKRDLGLGVKEEELMSNDVAGEEAIEE